MSSNTLATPQQIAATAAALVGQDLGLAGRIYRDLEAEFGGGMGSVVKVRIPGAVQASTRGIGDTATPLVTSNVVEQTLDVVLTDDVYSSVPLSAADVDLNIQSYATQILRPQALGIVKHIERAVVAAMRATPETTTIAYDAAAPAKAFTAARAQLRSNGVDSETPLLAAVGSKVYGDLLDAPARLGFDDDGKKVRGIEVIESNRLAADEIVVFVKTAFALVCRAPQAPQGAPFAASVIEEDFALTAIRAYDPAVNADKSIVQAFVEVAPLPLPVDNEDGTVSLVPHGGAVHVVASTIPA